MNNFTGRNNPLDINLGNNAIDTRSSLEKINPLPLRTSGASSLTTTNVVNGLKGEYYDNIDFTNLKLTRTDATVNFDWGNGSPDPAIGVDTFSVRWSGQVAPLYSENYTFYTTSDDGVRLFVNGQQIINRFVDQAATEVSGTINLEAGQKYDIRLEYYENRGRAVSRLAWSSNTQAKQIIPQSQLFLAVDPTATLDAANITTRGEQTYTFQVTYNDDTAIDVSSLDSNDILVTGVNGFSQLATLVSVDNNTNGTPRTATYQINAPSDQWSVSNNGIYNIALQANQVSDTSGTFAKANNLGSFVVDISGAGTGLKAEYYDNIDFTNLKLTRTDPTVNFDWGNGSPDPLIAADTFSVRWSGRVEAKYNETYTFYTTTDDGVRLFVNGQQIINRFVDQAATEVSGTINLQAGQKYDIRLEYYENRGRAVSKLSWSSQSQQKQIIPQSQLYLPFIPPTIALEEAPTTVNESNGFANIIVSRTGEDLTETSTVRYTTVGETATPGLDYIETLGTLTFRTGETRKTLFIPIINDTEVESPETFTFIIDQPQNADLGPQRTVRITIEDNDVSELTFSEPIVNESDGTAIVTVRRGNGINTASVNYTTIDGTARAGLDYQAVSGTLNFVVGEVSKDIAIPIINDAIGEPNEKFTLKFSNPVNVGLNISDTTEITIIDDDPGSFVKETIVSGLNQPTAFDWTPDGNRLFIAQKDGIVRVYENGTLLDTPFANISGQVNNVRDRGLLGMAIHPNFPTTPYVYLLFTYDPPEAYNNINPNTNLDDPDGAGNRPARLIRLTADASTNYTTAVIGSEVVLLGKNSTWANTSRPDANSTGNFTIAPSGITKLDGTRFANTNEYLSNLTNLINVQDYIATDSESHTIGGLRFGTDGSLFVSVGDGASYNRVDPRAIRVQDIDNLSGKILRIDPITGEGLSNNPFFDGDANSNRSKVYDYGLRNPFRFTIDEQTNIPFIGDVGWKTWEEVNTGRGVNFGWPYFEGGNSQSIRQPEYASLPAAQNFYNSGAPVTAPVYGYEHFGFNAIIMGDFYTGDTFPSIYRNSLFIGDSSQSTIDTLTFNAQGQFTGIRRFASNVGTPVQITTGPDSNLYYANIAGGEIARWRPATS
jgi:glucose/arabinose dehydrogenase